MHIYAHNMIDGAHNACKKKTVLMTLDLIVTYTEFVIMFTDNFFV